MVGMCTLQSVRAQPLTLSVCVCSSGLSMLPLPPPPAKRQGWTLWFSWFLANEARVVLLPQSLVFATNHFTDFEDCVATSLMEWAVRPTTFYYSGAQRCNAAPWGLARNVPARWLQAERWVRGMVTAASMTTWMARPTPRSPWRRCNTTGKLALPAPHAASLLAACARTPTPPVASFFSSCRAVPPTPPAGPDPVSARRGVGIESSRCMRCPRGRC